MSFFDPSMVPMLEIFIYESTTLLNQLDEILLEAEKEKILTEDNINEIFRTMHTIKGSSAMMGLAGISALAHHVEDMFYLIREDTSKMHDSNRSHIFDLLFQASDFFKSEVEVIQQGGDYVPADSVVLTAEIAQEAAEMKGEAPVTPKAQSAIPASEAPAEIKPIVEATSVDVSAEEPASDSSSSDSVELHYIRVFFEDDCQMENIRAFALITQVKDSCKSLDSIPPAPETNSACASDIVRDGLLLILEPIATIAEVYSLIESAMNIKSYEDVTDVMRETAPQNPAAVTPDTAADLASTPDPAVQSNIPEPAEQAVSTPAPAAPTAPEVAAPAAVIAAANAAVKNGMGKQSLISVNQSKLDQLMDIMGEIVIAESMVASNPELKGLHLDNFYKSTRQLRKLTDQLQDVVMSIRMVPLTGVFQKMNRLIRDMNKKLGKEVDLVTIGGETEVDKTINDVLGDPFMHMIRNSMDHGIENAEKRRASGKSVEGTITLSAQNMGGEIVIILSDDGQGLDRDRIIAKATNNGILTKPENEYTDKEIYGLIMLPGFSTNEVVTEYSGRGVGMDVVRKNLETVGGSISVDSKRGVGTTFTIKIPLTLAIVDGMEIAVKDDTYTIPITSIKSTFKLSNDTQLLTDPDGNEMIMLRGDCYPIMRLHQIYNIPTEITDFEEGIFILVENDTKAACIFVDQLIGEQQVVVKPFPLFLNRYDIKNSGLSGCTIMGDGSISLILDINNFLNKF